MNKSYDILEIMDKPFDLGKVTTVHLAKELESRLDVRSTLVSEEEFSKILVSGDKEKQLRYIKGNGPLMILEIKL